MIKYLFAILSVIGIGYLLLPLVMEFSTADKMPDLANEYVMGSVKDLNIPNVVTAVVVTYRGLDTLGEVTVLFLATAGVGFFLRKKRAVKDVRREGSEILKTGAAFLSPLIIIFGVYIFTHGHLSPGGGFQGGVVIASAFLLLVMSCSKCPALNHLMHITESLSGAGYVLLGILGLLFLGMHSFLDPRFLPAGEYMSLLSAGAIPLIYSFIGLKVGSELSSVIDSLKDGGAAE